MSGPGRLHCDLYNSRLYEMARDTYSTVIPQSAKGFNACMVGLFWLPFSSTSLLCPPSCSWPLCGMVPSFSRCSPLLSFSSLSTSLFFLVTVFLPLRLRLLRLLSPSTSGTSSCCCSWPFAKWLLSLPLRDLSSLSSSFPGHRLQRCMSNTSPHSDRKQGAKRPFIEACQSSMLD